MKIEAINVRCLQTKTWDGVLLTIYVKNVTIDYERPEQKAQRKYILMEAK